MGRIRHLPLSDTGPASDRVWVRAEFPLAELLWAVKNDRVEEMVRSTLTHEYGNNDSFELLVREIKKSLLAGIALKLEESARQYEGGMAVLFCQNAVEEVEAVVKTTAKRYHDVLKHVPGWIGECPPNPSERK